MIIAGVDPGKSGAIVTLFEDGSTTVYRVPLLSFQKKGNKSKSAKPDWPLWAMSWKSAMDFDAPDVMVMEDVHGWKGQAAGASFSFGKAAGFALAIALPRPIHYAPPAVWKIKLGLMGQDKAASIAKAIELIPSLAPELTRVKDDGVAEAGLLAYYGLMTIAHR